MRIWLAIIASVFAVAGAVFYASQSQRSAADQGFRQAQLVDQLRTAMLEAEMALVQGLAGDRARALPRITAAQATVDKTLDELETLLGEHDERELVELHRTEAKRWHTLSVDDFAVLTGVAPTTRNALGKRLGPLTAFLDANTELREHVTEHRESDTAAAARIPVLIVVILSTVFLLAGGAVVRREQRRHIAETEAEAERRTSDVTFQESQRRLSEALQVAADQPEAHRLLRNHLQGTIPGSVVHVLNRNNSADRLEAATELPDDSLIADALLVSEPRSCIAVRLSRPYERGASSVEVLECELCGKLAGETSCRPLLVGGEVIGSVLVEREGGLVDAEERRIDESVDSAAPVLANLRNLAIAEMRAATDSLTGLPNRRSLDDALKRMLAQASRSMRPLTVVQIDLDHFKQVNDTFGHDKGDTVLAGFGALLRSSLRASDFAARSGGEEFVLLLPDTDRQGALQLVEKLRRSVHALRADGVDRRVTASMGVAVFPEDAVDEETLKRLADRALYTAKQHGRDRVETVSQMGPDAQLPAA